MSSTAEPALFTGRHARALNVIVDCILVAAFGGSAYLGFILILSGVVASLSFWLALGLQILIGVYTAVATIYLVLSSVDFALELDPIVNCPGSSR